MSYSGKTKSIQCCVSNTPSEIFGSEFLINIIKDNLSSL